MIKQPNSKQPKRTAKKIIAQYFTLTDKGYQLIEDESTLTPLRQIERNLLLLYQTEWDKMCEQSGLNSTHMGDRITDDQLNIFYQQIRLKIPDHCLDQSVFKRAYDLLMDFITYQNENFLSVAQAYPLPPKVTKVKVQSLSVTVNWVQNGKQIAHILNRVQKRWQATTEYTLSDILGWLVFSAIVYGGINDKHVLHSYLQTIILPDNRQPFIHFNVISHLRFKSKHYGNEYKNNKIYQNQQVIIAPIVMCWLIQLDAHLTQDQQQLTNKQSNTHIAVTQDLLTDTKQPYVYLKNVLNPLLTAYDIQTPSLNDVC